jgi:lysyl-tRNA synthetase, class II
MSLISKFLSPAIIKIAQDAGIHDQIETLLSSTKNDLSNPQTTSLKIQKLIDESVDKINSNVEMGFDNFTDLIEEGDYLQATGVLDYSNTGEASLFVENYKVLTKSLRPLPNKLEYDNTESRYLDRVSDFKMNTTDKNDLSVKEIVRIKNKYWSIWRDEMEKEGFLEVECPIMESVPGGAEAKPFTTFYNELDQEMYLRISLELPLKKLVAGGFEKVYEIGRIFRNEGSSPQHLQEYTQIEWYIAYKDYDWAAKFVKRVYQRVVDEILDTKIQIDYNGNKINWGEWCTAQEAQKNGWELVTSDSKNSDQTVGWPKIPYFDAVRYFSNGHIDTQNKTAEELCQMGHKLGLDDLTPELGLGTLMDKLWKKARINTHNPFFLILPPVELEPLAKRDPTNPNLTQRWQIVAGGAELGKAFSELNDPIDQFGRFDEQQKARDAGNDEAQFMDKDYIKAIEYGMPPMAGFGTSERFVSFLLGKHIRECVTFPHVRTQIDPKFKINYLLSKKLEIETELTKLGFKEPQTKSNMQIQELITPAEPTTKLLCLENTYNFACPAKVLETGDLEDKTYIILDQTVFYPQGGGQPSDIGTINSRNGAFQVTKCQIIEDKCYHFGSFSEGFLEVGEEVTVNIDEETRKLHARIHTAGHVLDLALADCGFEYEPTKGYHFPAGPYVEYQGHIDSNPELIVKIEASLAKIIGANPKVSFEYVNGTHANGKPMRIMHLEGYPDCPCGGTHVDQLSKIGTVKIRKIKNQGEFVRVAYSVE